eukprot:Sspe_Gene.25943::Locus_10565_Transcript_1_1_Confidence_1.000_Length_3867::g.25943::m.25943
MQPIKPPPTTRRVSLYDRWVEHAQSLPWWRKRCTIGNLNLLLSIAVLLINSACIWGLTFKNSQDRMCWYRARSSEVVEDTLSTCEENTKNVAALFLEESLKKAEHGFSGMLRVPYAAVTAMTSLLEAMPEEDISSGRWVSDELIAYFSSLFVPRVGGPEIAALRVHFPGTPHSSFLEMGPPQALFSRDERNRNEWEDGAVLAIYNNGSAPAERSTMGSVLRGGKVQFTMCGRCTEVNRTLPAEGPIRAGLQSPQLNTWPLAMQGSLQVVTLYSGVVARNGTVLGTVEVMMCSRKFSRFLRDAATGGSKIYAVQYSHATQSHATALAVSSGRIPFHPSMATNVSDPVIRSHASHMMNLKEGWDLHSYLYGYREWRNNSGHLFLYKVHVMVNPEYNLKCTIVTLVPYETVATALATRRRSAQDAVNDFLGTGDYYHERDFQVNLIVLGVSLIILTLIWLRVSQWFTRPLQHLVEDMYKVADMDLQELLPQRSSGHMITYEVMCIQISFGKMVERLKKVRPYIPQPVLTGSKEEEPGSPRSMSPLHREERTISRISPQHKPQDTTISSDFNAPAIGPTSVETAGTLLLFVVNGTTVYCDLNEYSVKVQKCVGESFGMILQLMGDSVLAGWNTFTRVSQPQECACNAALRIQNELRHSTGWHITIGHGLLRTGYIGISDEGQQASPFVLGSPLQEVKQLALLAPLLQARILLTTSVLTPSFITRPVDVILTGESTQEAFDTGWGASRPQVTTVCELLGTHIASDGYNRAFDLLTSYQLNEAEQELDSYLHGLGKGDVQALRLHHLVKHLVKDPPRKTDGEGKPEYFRRYLGWETFGVSGVVYGDEEVPSESDLGVNLEQHNSLRVAKDQLAIAMNEPEGDLPKTFTDITGNRVWYRSDEVIGCGASSKVYRGMSQEGFLVAMKVLSPVRSAERRGRYHSILFEKLEKAREGDSSQLEHVLQQMRSSTGHESQFLLSHILGSLSSVDSDKTLKAVCEHLTAEVNILTELRHTNIVPFSGVSAIPGHVVICTECVSSGSLQAVINQFGRLPPLAVKRYGLEIVKGLEYLHSKDIVHRDLKPANVLLLDTGDCKLADFGISAVLSSASKGCEAVGTLPFMAPEACRGEVSYVTDIWSFAITVFQMSTGTLPYDDAELQSAGFMHRLGEGQIRPDISPVESDTVMSSMLQRCLQFNPAMRCTASELLRSPFFFDRGANPLLYNSLTSFTGGPTPAG